MRRTLPKARCISEEMKSSRAVAVLVFLPSQDAYKLEHTSRKGDPYSHTVTNTWVEK